MYFLISLVRCFLSIFHFLKKICSMDWSSFHLLITTIIDSINYSDNLIHLILPDLDFNFEMNFRINKLKYFMEYQKLLIMNSIPAAISNQRS
ncbi:unnamed protein product [Moneuplotes crassus]|uniref:Uncharacterized protein n=1 Tax=Euplotes crassus TaxID=5936 RepID=A0AAD1XKI9_EUPCR|nr:unnamed protein product [Moneuplotes crassus]